MSVNPQWGLRYWVHPSTFHPVIVCERRQMKKLNWILSKNRILVSVWKFYHLSNDCHIAYSALFCSPSNRKPCNKHLISLVFFFSLWSTCLGHKLMGKNSVCNLQYRPKTLLVRLMSRRHGWKLPSNSWTLSSFVVVIYTLRHSFNSIQFLHCSWEHQWPCDAGTVCGHSWLQETKQKWG